MAGGRSQRHMREFTDHYDADASGHAKPLLLSNIGAQASGTTLNLATAAKFSGYPRTYSASGLPTGGSINAVTGVITGTGATGTFSTCIVTVANAYGSQASDTFEWVVT